MRIKEIESQIISNYETIKTLQKQVADLSKKNFSLSQLKENKLTELFIDYIELGTTYTFNSYAYLNGVQTGVKTDFKSPNFKDGDVIRFDKKNKKSRIIILIILVVFLLFFHLLLHLVIIMEFLTHVHLLILLMHILQILVVDIFKPYLVV